jgi:NTE family protein
MTTLDFKKFLDDSSGKIRDVVRVIRKYGWYKGDYFKQWVGQRIAAKTGSPESTFYDIYQARVEKGFKELYFLSTNLSTHYAEVFSHEKTPKIKVAEAVRRSMSIPLFFTACRGERNNLYVDGGVLNNYPVRVFDRLKYIEEDLAESHSHDADYYVEHNEALRAQQINISKYTYNKQTLGFRLDTAEEIGVFRDQKEPIKSDIRNLKDYAKELIRTIMGLQDTIHLNSEDWARTIYIDTCGVGTTEFDLTDEKKKELIESGREGTRKYFSEEFENISAAMVNRV